MDANKQEALQIVKARFDEWRGGRTKQTRIPSYLWSDVISLMTKYTMAQICAACGLTHQQVKSKLNEITSAEFAEVKKAHFAEVNITSESNDISETVYTTDNVYPFHKPASTNSQTHDVTITRADGTTLTITGVPYCDLDKTIKAFID